MNSALYWLINLYQIAWTLIRMDWPDKLWNSRFRFYWSCFIIVIWMVSFIKLKLLVICCWLVFIIHRCLLFNCCIYYYTKSRVFDFWSPPLLSIIIYYYTLLSIIISIIRTMNNVLLKGNTIKKLADFGWHWQHIGLERIHQKYIPCQLFLTSLDGHPSLQEHRLFFFITKYLTRLLYGA
jgi:hypothetical protein